MTGLDAFLSNLERRVHRALLAELTAKVGKDRRHAPERLLALADEHLSQSAAIQRRLDVARVAHARAKTPAERLRILEQALRAEGAPKRTLRALHRGFFDLDALAERAALAISHHETRVAMCLRLTAAAVDAESAPRALAQLCKLLGEAPTGTAACAAAEALADLSARKGVAPPLSDATWQQITSPLARSAGSRRAQSALVRAALQFDRVRTLELMRARLLEPHAVLDDFVMRQHFVVRLGALGMDGDAFSVLLDLAKQRDPSEHVRTALPDALRTLGGERAVEALSKMATGANADPSYRVRARAGFALVALLAQGVQTTLIPIEALLFDADERVKRMLMEELEAVAQDGQLNAKTSRRLAQAAQRAASAARDLDAAEPALRLLERLVPLMDPGLLAAQREIAPALDGLGKSESVTVRSSLDAVSFGRLLALQARSTFGLYAEAVAGGYRVTHGPILVRRLWRVLHELRARTPYKRQDQVHSVGRHFAGRLRAHSEQLAEATPTIPGEPLAVTRDGQWGTHLPTVDDLLSTPLFGPSEARLFSTRGITTITLPESFGARVQARLRLSRDYASLAADRNRALNPVDPSDVGRYRERLEALGIRIALEPYPRGDAPSVAIVPAAARNFVAQQHNAALALLPWSDALGDGLRYLISPSENTLPQLTVAVLLAGTALLGRNIARRHQIQLDRDSIPLVLGGWGTRGKSGTERLKAAMLHGQGLNVLVKTTGCEAMFIHGVPGRRPTEIFIHRSYDKATIWEQSHVLKLGARLRVQAFLWECMALSPPLVRTLQEEWMRDDLSTLTNAYPDHEDIQGPAGCNVAEVIASFMRTGGTTITSEEQMLPIFAQEARRKGAHLIIVPRREHELLAEDLLRRFPYNEHPRNIALVRRLAVELGLDPDLATADMADHVVPDLGVLKAYPEVEHRGRKLTFVNGMSANERTGFLSNWQRMGCERPHEQTVERGLWTVTVVNNRYDRVARSKAFADILVRDAAAERHVLIGTNLVGLRRYVEQALEPLLDELSLFQAGDSPDAFEIRLGRMRHRLRIGQATSEALLQELHSWTGKSCEHLRPQAEAALLEAAKRAQAGEALEVIVAALERSELANAARSLVQDELSEERVHFLARSAARRAVLASLERAALAARDRPAGESEVNGRQRSVYRALFLDNVVPLEDSTASGDQVIDFIARAMPPGARATLMGTQNIKGTGLDFVYRFVRYEEVKTLVERLEHATAPLARATADELAARSDWGMLDAMLAASSLKSAATRFAGETELTEYLHNVAQQVAEKHAEKQRAGTSSRGRALRRLVAKAMDSFDAVRRRLRAEELLDMLVHQEISHERAALEARRLVDREKNGWL